MLRHRYSRPLRRCLVMCVAANVMAVVVVAPLLSALQWSKPHLPQELQRIPRLPESAMIRTFEENVQFPGPRNMMKLSQEDHPAIKEIFDSAKNELPPVNNDRRMKKLVQDVLDNVNDGDKDYIGDDGQRVKSRKIVNQDHETWGDGDRGLHVEWEGSDQGGQGGRPDDAPGQDESERLPERHWVGRDHAQPHHGIKKALKSQHSDAQHAPSVVIDKSKVVLLRSRRENSNDIISKKLDFNNKSVCVTRNNTLLYGKTVKLDHSFVVEYTSHMRCLADNNIAAYGDAFVSFSNLMIDPSRNFAKRKGGEPLEDVMGTPEREEHLKLTRGYFNVLCSNPPMWSFKRNGHLNKWAQTLTCTDTTKIGGNVTQVHELTIAVKRYEYVNLYLTMMDVYNTFLIMLVLGATPQETNILLMDAHPRGVLDPLWGTLFAGFRRAGHVSQPTMFHNFAWGLQGYSSPLTDTARRDGPYLEEFRTFVLTQHGVSTEHRKDCSRLNVIFIWRRNFIFHPRHRNGMVVRQFANETEMVLQAQESLGDTAVINGYQMETMTMQEQLKLIAQCDILIGMHGAGLTHILFLPQTSGVLELHPNYIPGTQSHFEAFARWRGVEHASWHNSVRNRKGKGESNSFTIPGQVLNQQLKALNKKICRNKQQ